MARYIFWVVFLLLGVTSEAVMAQGRPGDGLVISLANARSIAVRAAPSLDAQAIANVENGKVVMRKAQGDTDGFVMVQLADGRSGWIKGAFLVSAPVAVAQPVAPRVPPMPLAAVTGGQAGTQVQASPVAATDALPLAPASDIPVRSSRRMAQQREVVDEGSPIWLQVLIVMGLFSITLGAGWMLGNAHATRVIHERFEVIR